MCGTIALAACGDDDEETPEPSAMADTNTNGNDNAGGNTNSNNNDNSSSGPIAVPETYSFASRFEDGSSVIYTGQTSRHLLILELVDFIKASDGADFDFDLNANAALDALNAIFDFSNLDGNPNASISSVSRVSDALQTEYGQIGSLASLLEKMPDVDASFKGGEGEMDQALIGYKDGTFTPTSALRDMFQDYNDLISDRALNGPAKDPDGVDIALPFVAPNGVDYFQLIQKYLTGAIAYSQAADDYLDDDLPGKGLNSDNTMASEKNGNVLPYSALEHVWDEGFGYFGAARNYDAYSDAELSSKSGGDAREDWLGSHDTNSDGKIDFTSEYNFGHAVNAAKRDSSSNVSTVDYTQEAWDAFIRGRTLIVNSGGELSAAQLTELQGYRDTLIGAWEKAIAATAVHYINDTLQDMATFETDDYSFEDHAKHWSELKGFALILQFNVNHSIIETAELETILGLIGDAPVLPGATNVEAYKTALRDARDDFFEVYDFPMENKGDADGVGGW